MRHKGLVQLGLCTVVSAVSLASAGCGGSDSKTSSDTSAAATATPVAKTFAVHSSLDGLTVLPHRIRWTATTDAPEVQKVEFVIDGQVTWAEKETPYTFDEDGGYLVTSWIKPGTHQFEVRVTDTDGTVGSDQVTTRVVAAPAPPRALAGTWTRTVANTSSAPKDGSAGNPTSTHTPRGTYRLSFDRVAAQTRFPGTFASPASDDTGAGWILDVDATYAAGTLSARGGVTKQLFDGSQAEGGWWCTNQGPASAYTWSVSGKQLTLEPKTGKDACGIRGFIWAGTWKRAAT